VSNLEFPRFLSKLAPRLGRKALVQVNVDTGMGRFGARVDEISRLLTQLGELPALEVGGIFSHLSVADSEIPNDQRYTVSQIQRFVGLLTELKRLDLLPPLRHIGNSAGVIQYKDLVTSGDLNMVRIGTLLYGYLEVTRPWAKIVAPVATFITHVIALRQSSRGGFYWVRKSIPMFSAGAFCRGSSRIWCRVESAACSRGGDVDQRKACSNRREALPRPYHHRCLWNRWGLGWG
ncbi:MAG: alanine racemase, partial [Dehalococcoidia bacterium]|nr:alanine racemase [Dehalococcoidia bacterium]